MQRRNPERRPRRRPLDVAPLRGRSAKDRPERPARGRVPLPRRPLPPGRRGCGAALRGRRGRGGRRAPGGDPRGRPGPPAALRPPLRDRGRGVGHPRRGRGNPRPVRGPLRRRLGDVPAPAPPLGDPRHHRALGAPPLPQPQLPLLRLRGPARSGRRRVRRRAGGRVLALGPGRRPCRGRAGRHGRRPDGLVALRPGGGPPGDGDRRDRPGGGHADAHRPRRGHPVPRGGGPLPLGAAAHRGGDGGGRRGGPGDRRRPGGGRAPGRPLRPRRRLPDHGRGRLGPGRTAGRRGRAGGDPRVAAGQPGGQLGGGGGRLPLGRGAGAGRGRVRTGARRGGGPRGPAVGARARRRRRHRGPRGLPRPLPLEGGGLPRAPRTPGRREHRLVRGHGGRLQDGRHPVRVHRRHLPDRAARGGQLRRGGARLRVRAGPPPGGDQARPAAPDPGREARLRHEGRGLLLRRHPRPLPLLPVERPGGRGGGPERGPPAGQPVGAAVHQLGGVHRRRGPHVDGEPPRVREPGEPPACPRPHQPAGPAGAGGAHVHRRPPGGLGRRRDPGADGRLGGAVPRPGGPGHHAPHAGARLRERRQHRPRPGRRRGDVLDLGGGGDRPGRARLLPLAERGPEAAHRRRHRQDVERPHPRGLADLRPDPRGPGVHLRQLVPGGALAARPSPAPAP